MKKVKRIFRFLTLTSGKTWDSFAVIFHVYTFLLSPCMFTSTMPVSQQCCAEHFRHYNPASQPRPW